MPRSEEKERLFVAEYLKDFNGCQAAIRAGYSEKRGRQAGYELLQRPHIQEAIQKAVDKRAKKIGLSAEKVLESIERVAEAAESTEEYSSALKGYELLGKHLKLFTDKIELSGNVALAEKLKEARERSR